MSNSLASERISIVGIIPPQSLGTGATNSGWIPLANYGRLMAVIATGVLGTAATVDAKWQVADNSAGANPVDSTTAVALTQIVKASGDNKQAIMNFDVNAAVPYNKPFARLVVTVGAAASLGAVVILGTDPKYQPGASTDSLSTVVQTD